MFRSERRFPTYATPLLLILALFQSDGELRADYLAEATAQALARIRYGGQGIAFGAQLLAHRESFPGAELHAIAAALTSLPVYSHLPGLDSFLLVVEGLSPQLRMGRVFCTLHGGSSKFKRALRALLSGFMLSLRGFHVCCRLSISYYDSKSATPLQIPLRTTKPFGAFWQVLGIARPGFYDA